MKMLGAIGTIDNCADKSAQALQAMRFAEQFHASPLTLFMNVPWADDGRLAF